MSEPRITPLVINLRSLKEGKKPHKKHKKSKKKHKHHKHHHHKHGLIKEFVNPPILEPIDDGLEPVHHRTHDDDHYIAPITISIHAPPPPQPAISQPAASVVSPTKVPIVARHEEQTNGKVLGVASKEKTSSIDQTVPADKHVDANSSVVMADKTQNDEAASKMAVVEEEKEKVPQVKRPEPVVVQNTNTGAKISFLRMAEDGSVTMAIIGPTVGKPDDSNERILNLEQICGQLSDGTDVIPSQIDEEECRDALQVKPVDFVEASAFGTYLPVEDSTFANLTKDDTETLLEIYGSNATCYEYARSLQDYAKGTNYLMTMVDSLLDLLTEGKHRKEAVPIRDKLTDQKEEEQKQMSVSEEKVEEKQQQTPPPPPPPQPSAVATAPGENKQEPVAEDEKMEVDQIEVKPNDTTTTNNNNTTDPTTITTASTTTTTSASTNDLTITNSSTPADALETTLIETTTATTTEETTTTTAPEAANDNPEEIQKQLDAIENLLNELKHVQERRLSSSAAPVEPDEKETKLADEVLSMMTKLIKEKAKPGEICDSASIFKALGIPPLA